jgi:hypothetical protein
MSNLSTAKIYENEIVKAVDFSFSNDQTIQNIVAIMKGILTKGDFDMVIGGMVTPYQSGGMNVAIAPVFVHGREDNIDVVDTEQHQPISIEPASNIMDRIDIIQLRGIEEEYAYQNRKFRNPETEIISTQEISTKKRIKLDIMVKKGTNGENVAPQTDVGYVKLAEIFVLSGTVDITVDNIKNITARYSGAQNSDWTNEATKTFNPGYLTDIVEKFLANHTETGDHKTDVIKAPMIKFGNDTGYVNATIIPIGQSVSIQGVNYNALSVVAQIINALATAINLAYPYANNILSRYMLLPDTPVAASTENVDISTGGQLTIDGIVCSTGQLVFIKDQTDPKENGFWQVQTGSWNRYNGYTAETPDAFNNKLILIKAGTINHGKIFYMEKNSAIGNDNLVFMESMFSSYNLPGKVFIRDIEGKIISPSFTGTPTAPTAAAGTNSMQLATTAFVNTAITALIDSSPETLDTLNKLASALGDDPNFATTMINALAGKAPINATLTDEAESATLPATTNTPLTSLLQTVRNNLKYLSSQKAPINVLDTYLYIGKMVVQYPDELSPVEAGYPGTWEIWSHRAIMYGVSTSTLPSYSTYSQLAGLSIAAGSRPYTLVTEPGGDSQIYRFKSHDAAYLVPDDFDPVQWDLYTTGVTIVERQKCGNLLTAADLTIGSTIASGTHAGKYVTGIIVPGGKFWGVEGGKRPTFISGGVQEGRIRNVRGRTLIGMSVDSPGMYAAPFTRIAGSVSSYNMGGTPGTYAGAFGIDLSLSLVTGPDNAPTNVSTRFWRRIS